MEKIRAKKTLTVPYNRAYLSGNELKYITEVLNSLNSGGTLSGNGPYTKRAEYFIEDRFGASKALLTTSCTAALELATLLIGVKPGDEVIVPSYTFSSTINPLLLVGAKPVFADIDAETFNIDTNDVRQKITPETKAIYPVHYAGVACDMDEIIAIAQRHNLFVVEDAAQGVNAQHKNKYLGTIGDFGCYSFHETKNYTCGEGGALLINTDDKTVLDRAEIICEKGTDRCKFFRGEVDKYRWVDIGSSYFPSELLAAFLCAQFEALDFIQKSRRDLYDAYREAFLPLVQGGSIKLQKIPSYASCNAHLFPVVFQNGDTRDRWMHYLQRAGILAIFHYIPLHSSPMGLRLGNRVDDCPVSQRISERLLRLPMFAGISRAEKEHVLTTLEALVSDPESLERDGF
jgi:dTDP-4-amino-4,6-dideoxygalactose transaminase